MTDYRIYCLDATGHIAWPIGSKLRLMEMLSHKRGA